MPFVYDPPFNPDGPKTIDTLVSDIYAYIGGEGKFENMKDEDIEELSKNLASMFKRRLEERRDPEQKNQEFYLRMSNYGMPHRRLWFEANTPVQKKEIRKPHLLLNFLIGDIWEEVLLFLAKKTGHKVEYEQEQVDVLGQKGSTDAVIDDVVVDVKSASKWAFEKKFVGGSLFKGDDSFSYVPQIKGYDHGLSKKLNKKFNGQAFLVGCKEDGRIHLAKVPPFIKVDVEKTIKEAREVIALPTPPEDKCYPDEEHTHGNRKLGKNCSFCPFKFDCWKDANGGRGLRVFDYKAGPVYMTDVQKIPSGIPENFSHVLNREEEMEIYEE